MKLIAVTGHRLSGKSLFASYLHRKYGFVLLDFTHNVLSPMLRKQGKKTTRENLVELAMSLRKEHGTDILARKLWDKASHGKHVISGIRFPEEVGYFQKMFERDFVLIAIECDPRIRYERINRKKTKEQKDMTYEQFMKKDKFPTEKIISKTIKLAKFTVKNTGKKQDLYEQTDKLMERIYINKARK